jgi:hypothetical protein
MLGFRTTSRRRAAGTPTTLRCLRQARQDWRNKGLVDAVGCPEGTHVDRHHKHRQADDKDDEDTILVLGHWQYRRRGHAPGEGIHARTIAHDLRVPTDCSADNE